ncbi:MAG: hypothetical protein ACMUJM_13895 [bacterium]
MLRLKFIVYSVLFLFFYLSIPLFGETFIFDDFEYWDAPYNHGWVTSDPSYPLMGFGIGYGLCYTHLDQAEGSRVLKVESQASVFNELQPYELAKYHIFDPGTGQAPTQPIFSYKINDPLSIERFDQARCYLLIMTQEGEYLWLCYLPLEGTTPLDLGHFMPIIPPPQDLISGPIRCIGYPLGRSVADSTWHCVVRDIQKDLDLAGEENFVIAPQYLQSIHGILFSGNQYCVDDIMFFYDQSSFRNYHPFVLNPGPQFATLFEPYELILYAIDRENDELSFDLQISGWGIHGISTKDLLEPLFYDPNDPYDSPTGYRAAFRFTPMTVENLLVTVTVSDKYTSDITMFPLSVVNYPVENHAPVIQRSGYRSKWVGYVNELFTYRVKAFDKEYDSLTYSATINGLPNYQYGPWQESIINPKTGLVEFTPRFEGNYKVTIQVRDEKGALGQTSWDLFVVNRGSWYNHPPVRVVNIKTPQLAKAGSHYTIATGFVDPDGDELYYSTNIGSITSEGSFSFLTYFPGQYQVSIIAYDIHGGLAYLRFLLDVQPWWSTQ